MSGRADGRKTEGNIAHRGHNGRVTGAHRPPETPDERAAAKRRRHTVIAVVIVVLGSIALTAVMWWQQTRHDDYGRDLGCAFSEARGQDDRDCD